MGIRRFAMTSPPQRPTTDEAHASKVSMIATRRDAFGPLALAGAAGLLSQAGLVGSLAGLWVPSAHAQAVTLPLTPRQTEGPYYPTILPTDTDHDLLVNGAQTYAVAQRALVEGVVLNRRSQPVPRAVVEIWQCDEKGRYHHPSDGGADPAFQGFGRVTVGADGRFAFKTMRPSRYVGRTPHIHVKVKLDGRELLTTQLYVQGEADNERDSLWRRLSAESRAALTRPFTQRNDGWLQADFPIVVDV
jgi:protocatechuate 3,4-dioxygenase, beta subunit